MCRAPIFPHKVSSTDYLLVRSAKGKISIRRIDRLDVVGQQVCAYESMLAGLCKLKQLGITRLTNSNGLSSAMNQLPDEAIALAAASHIERELQITPWSLSSNFVACTSQVNYFTLIPCILSTSAADVVIVQILVWASELCGFVVVGVYYCITASCSSCLGA
ncbi:transcription initiation factor TFIID subunit 1-like isoform X3 [Camellia sinensis]|uniref:transcription initiation factor TFIID subunit 1-like isoform X3 n=1 Tax=Camellia sinensis TaxID=4442 RepID=UPI001035976C|nr:transcription initiation factor TFIID subunit 1-like isoform X3 [Camellia sinensis]